MPGPRPIPGETPAMLSIRLSQLFSWLGHATMHLLVALYLTVVLALEREWGLAYDELIGLWTLGAFLLGVGAPLAGWLGDRWSTPLMMVVFFIGAGAATIAAGLASEPWQMLAALAALGLFASIYHPVGFSWLVRSSRRRGTSLGFLALFGTLGVAAAGTVAGGLIDTIDWRAAFVVPGAVSVAIGLALLACLRSGLVVDTREDVAPQPAASRQDTVRAFVVLSMTVFCGGLIYQSTQVGMPKLFSERLAGMLGEGTIGVGALFTLVYLVAGLCQLVGGYLADRYPLKTVYVWSYVVQVPLLFIAASLSGLPLIAVVVLMVVFNTGALPAENTLMARYTPARWRGTAFGAKFVLSLGVTPVAVQLVAWTYALSGGFYWLFVVLGVAATVAIAAGLMLPSSPRERALAARPAE